MPDRTCSIDGCDKPHNARDLCHMHYMRERRGNPSFVAYSSHPADHTIECERCHRQYRYWRTARARTVCAPCREVDWAWKLYGLHSVSLPAFYEAHGNRCDICGGTESLTQWGHRLVIDHDHVTGELRGLLCNTCNAGLGQFGDDPERLRAAMEYVAMHRQPNRQLRLLS